MPGAVPTDRHEPIPIDFGPVSKCGHDPITFKLRDSSAEATRGSGGEGTPLGGPKPST
jgi:hypothetical protein